MHQDQSAAFGRLEWLTVLLLIVGWGFLIFRIDNPLYTFNSGPGAWILASVRNFIEFGPETFNYLPTRQTGPPDPANYYPYTNHPPFQVFYTWFFVNLLGRSEFTIRFAYNLILMLGLSAAFVMGRRLLDRTTGLLTVVVLLLMPMMVYMGQSPNLTMLALCFHLILVAIYLNWLHAPTWLRLLALAVVVALALSADWSALPFVGLFGLLTLVIGTNRHRVQTLVLGGVALAVLGAMFAYYSAGSPAYRESLTAAFYQRACLADCTTRVEQTTERVTDYLRGGYNQMGVYELPETTLSALFVDILFDWLQTAGPGVMLLVVVGVVPSYRHLSRNGRLVVATLFTAALAYVLIVANGTLEHNWYVIVFFPAFAVVGAVGLRHWPRFSARWRAWRGAVLVMAAIGMLTLYMAYHASLHTPYLTLGEREATYEQTIRTLTAATDPADTIMSNLPFVYTNIVIEYYAYRNVIWSVTPEQALATAQTRGDNVTYMYCTQDNEIPTVLRDHPVREGENTCLIFDIQP